ncbi:MAG: hypothetical protein HYY50_05085 [Candidatus Kerfeldbacteria bacterium]|nr:hypothetical protein [Candidatus Kerfeldbacteria bacterium]
MADSWWLSVFYVVFLMLSAWVTERGTLAGIQSKRPLAADRLRLVTVSGLLVVMVSAVMTLVLAHGDRDRLTTLNLLLTAGGVFLTAFLVLPAAQISTRVVVSLACTIVGTLVGWFVPGSLVEMIVMAVSLLWVGLAVTKILRLPLGGHLVLLTMMMLMDIYNIWLTPSTGSASDKTSQLPQLHYDGIFAFGDYSLGIGDFFIGAWAVGVLVIFRHQRLAFIGAAMIGMFRFFYRFWPGLETVTIPYTIVIVPTAALLLAWSKKSFGSTPNQVFSR